MPWHRSDLDLEGYPLGSCSLVRRLELFLVLSATRPPGKTTEAVAWARAGAPAVWTMGAQGPGGSGPALWRGDRAQAPLSTELESRETPKPERRAPCFERQQQPGCGDLLAGGALQLASRARRREEERPGKSVMPAPASPSPAAGRTEWLFPGLRHWATGQAQSLGVASKGVCIRCMNLWRRRTKVTPLDVSQNVAFACKKALSSPE